MDNGIKILILDDNPIDVELIKKQLLQDFPTINFLAVATEQEYKGSLETFKPDVIISDYSLDQYSGFKAFSLLKELNVHIPFILVSGTLPDKAFAIVKDMGFDDFLSKDNLRALPSIVKAALERKKLLNNSK